MYSHAVYFFFKGVELPKNIQIRTFLHDVKKSKYILVLMYEKFFKNLLFLKNSIRENYQSFQILYLQVIRSHCHIKVTYLTHDTADKNS